MDKSTKCPADDTSSAGKSTFIGTESKAWRVALTCDDNETMNKRATQTDTLPFHLVDDDRLQSGSSNLNNANWDRQGLTETECKPTNLLRAEASEVRDTVVVLKI